MLIATTHKNTDFDGLASVIAATLLYPGCIGVVPKMTNKNVKKFLSTHKTAFNLILPHEVEHHKVKKLIVVDTSQWRRLDRMKKLQDRQDLEIELWDHHMGDDGDIVADWQCRERIGSTVTLLAREMKKKSMTLSPLDSTVMLIGLYEDTGHLSYPSTTGEDARVAAYLLDNGADLNVANFFLNPPYEKKQREILFEMTKDTDRRVIAGYSVGFNLLDLDSSVVNLASVVDMYRKIINVDALFAIFSNNRQNTVIGRSSVEAINIGEILKPLGGGGHGGAGSATIKTAVASAQQLKNNIISALETGKSDTVPISDIMSFPIISVTPETSMRQAQQLMAEKGIRGIAVMEGDTIHGILVLWDLKKLTKERQWQSPVKAFMTRDVTTIDPTTPPTRVARIMIEKDIGYLPVVQQGKVIGIVTRTDILTYYYDLLPD
jgi:tRNA nucleotidyltransferase (CCA-adding enzyme)